MARDDIQARVRRLAEQMLAEQHYVRPVDVLLGLGWLAPPHLDQWRQGRVPYLESVVQANLSKVSTAMTELRRWARARELVPSQTAYVARTRDRRALRFSASNDPDIERAYRTHWISPELPERRREQLTERHSRPPDLLVIAAGRPWTCSTCAAEFGRGEFLMIDDDRPSCLDCADLGHLEFLPSGNTALTRRAKSASPLSAVVVRWSRARKRYERQGILATVEAIDQAETQCLTDRELRERRRERDEARRQAADRAFVAELATAIRARFPGCPDDRAEAIARHAGTRGSGRIGRTSSGRALDPEAVRLAVIAAVRHTDTPYDELLMTGMPREIARAQVRDDIERILHAWSATDASQPPAD